MRITLDRNQLVRALMRPPQLATFVMAWEARRFSRVLATAIFGAVEFLVTADDDLRTPEIRAILHEAKTEVLSIDDLISLLDRGT